MKTIFFCIAMITTFLMQAQDQLNDYKYIVIPKKFDGFKKENQYETSTLVKNLFVKRGFITIYEDSMPVDIDKNSCLGLYANLIDASLMITTKASLVLKDCSGKEIFSTKQGSSKIKDKKTAYSEVLHEAMESFNGIAHKYSTTKEAPISVNFSNDIKKIDKKPKLVICKNKSIIQEATPDKQSYKDRTPISSNIKKATSVKKEAVEQNEIKSLSNNHATAKQMFCAQEIPNGYEVVDSTSKVLLKLYKSSIPNVYLAKAEDKNGVVYAKNEQWFFEYYRGSELITEVIKIKF